MNKTCPKCFGTTWVLQENGVAVKCDCTKEINNTLFRTMKIPPSFYDKILCNDAFSPYIKTFLNIFKNQHKSLCIIGPHGVGKTHLAIDIMVQMYKELNISGIYYDVREMLYELKSDIADGKAYHSLLRELRSLPLLILDGLGTEGAKDFNTEIVSYLIYHRSNYNLPTIITTTIGYAPTQQEIVITNTPKQRAIGTTNRPMKTRQFIPFNHLSDHIQDELTKKLGNAVITRVADNYVFFVMNLI